MENNFVWGKNNKGSELFEKAKRKVKKRPEKP